MTPSTDFSLRTRPSYVPGGAREMLSVALPMIASAACDTAMTFTDRLFLSRLGTPFMSAAMAGGLTAFMLMTFFVGLTGYTTAIVAQYLGARRPDKCALALTQALIICVIAYPIILLMRPLGYYLFAHANLDPTQAIPQRIYFDILVWGAIVGLLRQCFAAFFSGLGRTRIVMMSALGAMIANVVANYLLIFGKGGFPALGIAGAAYGTIFGSGVGLLVLVVGYFWPANRREFAVMKAWRFSRSAMGKLIHFGYPAGLELFLNLLAFNMLILAFHARGPEAAAATTVVFNWDMVSFIPLLGVNIGVTSLVGRYMGAGRPDTAHRATMSGLKLGWSYSFIMLLIFSLFAHPLVMVFRPAEHAELFDRVAPLAVVMLRLVSIYVLADATSLVFSGALRAAGDTLWAMGLSVGFHYILVGAAIVLLHYFHTSVETAWTTVVFIILSASGLFYLRYRSGAWRKIRVISPEEEALAQTPTIADGLHETTDL